jgi:hypothetical protein
MGIFKKIGKALNPKKVWNPIETSDWARKQTHKALLKPGDAEKWSAKTRWSKNREWFVPLAAAVATFYMGGAGGPAAAGAQGGSMGAQGASLAAAQSGAGAAAAGGGGAAAAAGSAGTALTVGSTVQQGMAAGTAAREGKIALKKRERKERRNTALLAQMAYNESFMGGSRSMLKARPSGGKVTVG